MNDACNRMSQKVGVHIECVRAYVYVCFCLLVRIFMTMPVSLKVCVCSCHGSTFGVRCPRKQLKLMKRGKSLEYFPFAQTNPEIMIQVVYNRKLYKENCH